MAGRLVSGKELAEILDVTRATITKWTHDHGMPRVTEGRQGTQHQYDLGACFRWYGQWQVDKVLIPSGEGRGKLIDIKTEEARLKKHQADKAEVDAQTARNEVLLVEDVKDTLDEIAIAFGSQLDALGGRLANELAAITDPAEIRQVVFAESRRIRSATADALEALAAQDITEIGEAGESASPEDSGPVGGRESDTPAWLG